METPIQPPVVKPKRGLMEKSITTVLISKMLIIRALISAFVLGLFIFILWMLFHRTLEDKFRDLLNIIIGSYLIMLGKVIDYWFTKKEKEDDASADHLKDEPEEIQKLKK